MLMMIKRRKAKTFFGWSLRCRKEALEHDQREETIYSRVESLLNVLLKLLKAPPMRRALSDIAEPFEEMEAALFWRLVEGFISSTKLPEPPRPVW